MNKFIGNFLYLSIIVLLVTKFFIETTNNLKTQQNVNKFLGFLVFLFNLIFFILEENSRN